MKTLSVVQAWTHFINVTKSILPGPGNYSNRNVRAGLKTRITDRTRVKNGLEGGPLHITSCNMENTGWESINML